MPDRQFKEGMACWLTGNVHEEPIIEAIFDEDKSRIVHVVEQDEYDEEWGDKWKVRTCDGDVVVASQQDISPMPDLGQHATQRGFWKVEFTDLYGSECSLQESSLATEGAIWFGINSGGAFELKPPYSKNRNDPDVDTGGRMHLSQGQAAALLPLLQHFVETGGLP
jgi:hypothetical protein